MRKTKSKQYSGGSLALKWEEPEFEKAAITLARELDLPTFLEKAADYFLLLDGTGLKLKPAGKKRGGVRVDFLDNALLQRLKTSSGKRDLLIRAIGEVASPNHVFDATAGFGVDAVRLAYQGYHVLSAERIPFLYAMLRDAWDRATEDGRFADLSSRLLFLRQDSRDYLRASIEPPKVVYIDVMYPRAEKKSALPSFEMQVLRDLAGDDSDAGELFDLAMQKATGRVVVKRPPKAPLIGRQKPNFQLGGKMVRFDVYLKEK